MKPGFPDVTGVILAGGQASRMGGEDKGLIRISGKAMIEYVIAALECQLHNMIINANRNLASYRAYGLPVIPDMEDGFQGPLAGIASCMKYVETDYMITAPCDSPNLPDDYVARMYRCMLDGQADISVADSGSRIQPVFSLLRCSLLDSLLSYLESGERKIDRWFDRHSIVRVDFSDRPGAFININTPEDVILVERGRENGPA